MSGTRMGCKRWTPEEDAVVLEHYPRRGMKWDGWDELLPRRSRNAIRVRAHSLGSGVDPDVIMANCAAAGSASLGAHRWTDDEVASLATWYPLYGAGWAGWGDVLPGLRVGDIAAKAKALGLRRHHAARPVGDGDRREILATVVALASELRLPPRDVALEMVRLAIRYERQAAS